MRQQIPLTIVFITGIIMIFQFFVPHAYSEALFAYANDFVIVIGICALPLGIYSLMSGTIRKALKNPRESFYSFLTIAGFLAMIIFGLRHESFTNQESYLTKLFTYVLMPCQMSLFSMLAFYIASAAYRAFRVRTWLATVLLVTAFIIMLRIVPLPEPLSGWNSSLVQWIMAVPNMAAKRAIILGVALGAIAYSMKIILGIERGYMGKD